MPPDMSVDQTSLIILSLERLNEKIDKHDDKFDGITKALETLIKVDIESRETKVAVERAFKRIEALEHAHNKEGCVVCQQIDSRHTSELKRANDEHAKIFERLGALEKRPTETMDLIKKGFLGAVGVGAYTWFMTHFMK